MNKKNILRGIIGLALSNCLYGYEFQKPKEVSIKYLHNYANINGFVQIPKGGQFGSTTTRKPEFNELGIDNINFPKIEINMKWNNLFLYSGVNYNTFKGSSTLEYDLISHDRYLKKGSKIKTEHQYISYDLGFGYSKAFYENITLSPFLQITATQFNYQYDSKYLDENTISSGRKFGLGSIHTGLKSTYKFNDKYKIDLNFKYAIPFDSVRKWGSLEILNTYNVYEKNNHKLNVLFGIGFEYFEYRDTQKDMQNFMKHKLEPIYKLGLEYSF